MLAQARRRADDLRRPVALVEADAQRLPFPDASFDTVAVTFVLLCLPDELQLPALRELRRVTCPGGRVLLLDYRGSGRRHVQVWTKALSTWLRWAFAARFDPATDRYIHPAGLRVETRRSHMGDGVALLVLRRDDDPAATAAAPASAEPA
jgi:ubiquinone/menaquinone biosynthesis C-methylase UbiE